VIGVSASHSHPSVVPAAGHVGARFVDTAGVGGLVFAVALGVFAISRSLWLSVVLLFVLGNALIVFSTAVSTQIFANSVGRRGGAGGASYTAPGCPFTA
jgi:hypothetical protein